eukprot:5773906-Pleurochrysis_carterae.AAC.1
MLLSQPTGCACGESSNVLPLLSTSSAEAAQLSKRTRSNQTACPNTLSSTRPRKLLPLSRLSNTACCCSACPTGCGTALALPACSVGCRARATPAKLDL